MGSESPEARARLGIVGAGTMGSGIALAALLIGWRVGLVDVSHDVLDRGLNYLRHHLDRKGQLKALEYLTTDSSLSSLADCEVVVEAVPEDLDLKRKVFGELEEICSSDCLLATNTSTLSVTAIAAVLDAPERAVGIHFFNPAAVLPLVEVVQAAQTSDRTVERAVALAEQMGKTPVVVQDSPGFIVNRVARPFYGEALKLLGEGAADVRTLDWILEHGAGFPMGPFRLMDLIGIDVNLAATQSVFEQTFGEPRYRPHPIQRRKVLQGRLGRKTGAGFYTYPTGEGEELPKLPTAATDAGPFVVSQGTWAPGLQAQLRSAGKLAEKARDAQAGFVAAGRAEDLASLLAALDGDLPADRVLLCQSTDITLHEASQWAVHPERLVGFDGWFLASGDVAVLTKGPATTSESCASAEEVVRSLGKLPLWVDDPPGMVAPRVVAMLVNEAAFAMGEGVAEEATIDRAMELGVRHPQGPIRWGRSLGFQRVLAVLEQLQREFGEERYRPAPWLRRQVRTGTSAQANG